MGKLLICASLVLLCLNVVEHVAATRDKKAEAGKVIVTVLGQSGKILFRKKGKEEKEAIIISMDELKEKNENDNDVGSSGRRRHSFNTFANQDFTFSPLVNTSFQGIAAKSFKFSAYIASTGANLTCVIYIFEGSGEIVFGEEASSVKNGTMKFNVEVRNWEFCNGTVTGCKKGQKEEFGSFLDFTICIKSKKGPVKKGRRKQSKKHPGKRGMEQIDLGDDAGMDLSNGVMLDGILSTMPEGYPKLEKRGAKNCYTFRFPKFKSVALFDPIVDLAAGSAAAVVKFSGVLVSFLVIIVGYLAY